MSESRTPRIAAQSHTPRIASQTVAHAAYHVSVAHAAARNLRSRTQQPASQSHSQGPFCRRRDIYTSHVNLDVGLWPTPSMHNTTQDRGTQSANTHEERKEHTRVLWTRNMELSGSMVQQCMPLYIITSPCLAPRIQPISANAKSPPATGPAPMSTHTSTVSQKSGSWCETGQKSSVSPAV